MPGKSVHTHAAGPIKMAENMSVGRIREPLRAAIFRPIKTVTVDELETQKWTIIKKTMLNGAHAVFRFTNENFKIAGILPYFDHCGKYYTVSRAERVVAVFEVSEHEPELGLHIHADGHTDPALSGDAGSLYRGQGLQDSFR